MTVVWKADATRGIETEFASMSTDLHCGGVTYAGLTDPNIYQVADATARNGRAYRAEITDSSNTYIPSGSTVPTGCYTSGIREEINMGNPSKTFADGVDRTFHEGQERWVSCQFKLDASFPTHATYRGSSVMQFHPAVSDGGLFNLGAGGQTADTIDKWEIWGYTGAAPSNRGSFQAPLGDLLATRGVWVKFTFHILFSSVEPPVGPAVGFFECYSDVQNPGNLATLPLLFSSYNVATMKSNRAYHFLTFGFYPAVRPQPPAAMNMCGLTCATDRVSAEASAFGGVASPSGVAYYVNNTGSDANTGLSPATAWRTVAHVNVQTFNPGDQILFQGGQSFTDTDLEVYSSGTAGLPVTFSSYGVGRATFNQIYCSGYDYLTFSNVAVVYAAGLPFNGTGNHITVDNCLIDGLSNQTTGGSVQLGISAKGDNWAITNSTVQNTGLSGIEWYGDTLTATGNTVTNVGLRSPGSANPAVGYNAHGLYIGQSRAVPIVGVNHITNFDYMSGLVTLMKGIGVTHDRIDANLADLSNITRAVGNGLHPLVVYKPAPGLSPATYASQLVTLVAGLAGTGVTLIEFVNEPYYNGWTPATYAAAYSAAHAAIAGSGITLLMAAFGDYQRADMTWSADAGGGGWIHDTIAALPGGVPGGAAIIDAWAAHPYGPMTGVQGGDTGWAAMPNHRSWAVAYGSSAPFYVTEVGQQLDGANAVTAAQQAADLTQYFNDCVNLYPWVLGVWWYAVVDDGTGKWGLFDVLDTDNSVAPSNERPSYTALAAWNTALVGINATVDSNQIYNAAGSEAMMASGVSQRSRNGTVTNNTIHNCMVGIDFYESDPIAGSTVWSNNQIYNTTSVFMYAQGPTGGDYPTAESFTIQNNTIGPILAGSATIDVLPSYTTGTVTISGNVAPAVPGVSVLGMLGTAALASFELGAPVGITVAPITASDAITVSDTATGVRSALPTRAASDAVTVSDTATGVRSGRPTRAASDTVAVSDAARASIGRTRAADTVAIISTAAWAIPSVIVGVETLPTHAKITVYTSRATLTASRATASIAVYSSHASIAPYSSKSKLEITNDPAVVFV